MVSHHESESHEILERATEALRQGPLSDAPPPHVMRSTLEAVQAVALRPDPVPRNPRKLLILRVGRYTGVAAAAGLLAVAGWLVLIDRSAGTLFAAVRENVKEAMSVSYSNSGTIDGKPLATFRESIAGDHLRLEYENGGSHVVDLEQKKGLILEPQRKLAFEYPVDEKAAAEQRSRVSQLRELLESNEARSLGTETLEGREVVAYSVTVQETAKGLWAYPGAVNTVWVDPQTKLPVRVEIRWSNGDWIRYDHILWNEPIAAERFQLHVPEGYRVTTAEERLKAEK